MSRCSCARRSSRWSRRFSAWRASSVGATWPAGSCLNCCFQALRLCSLIPSSAASCPPDRPLISQCSTAWRLKASSYRFYLVWDGWFMRGLPSSHTHPPPVHQIGARLVTETLPISHPFDKLGGFTPFIAPAGATMVSIM
jgi:hypothetical protein